MPRDHYIVVEEMLETIRGIEAAIADRTFEEYQNDWVLRRAVERGLEIISEASRHLPAQWINQHPHNHVVESPFPRQYSSPRVSHRRGSRSLAHL